MMAADAIARREQETGTADGCTEIARGFGCKIRLVETRSPPETPTCAPSARASGRPDDGNRGT
jgi:hypothetical protein